MTLVITGGLRTHPDFVKALALGADAIAISNAAIQAIGCLGHAGLRHRQLPGRHRHAEAGPSQLGWWSTTRRAG